MSGSKRLLSVIVIAGSVSLLTVGCGGGNPSNGAVQSGEVVDAKARDDIAKINKYLGTTDGQGANHTTLLQNIRENNKDLQKALTTMQCDIWKLQHPGQTNCPGPSTSPTVPPKYPQ